MHTKRLARIESSAVTCLLVFTILGYPLIALIPTVLDKASTFASIPYRFAILAIASLILVLQLMKLISAWRMNRLIKLFIIFYLMRLVWDLIYLDIPNASHALLFFAVICLPPALVFGRAGRSAVNEVQLSVGLILLGSIVCWGALMMHFLDIGLNRSLMATTGRLSFEALNPISLGYVAVTTLIAVVWLSNRHSWTVWRIVSLSLVIIIPAIGCLELVSSRGPVVGFGVCMLWCFFTMPSSRSKILIVFITLVVLFIISPWHISGIFGSILHLGGNFDLGSNFHLGSNSHTRFAGGFSDPSSIARLALLKQATEIFLRSPWIGAAYIDYNSYPHNIFFEAAMSLGIVGLLILILLILRAVSYLNFFHHRNSSLLSILFIEYFINSQLSSSLWGMAEFWALLVLVTAQYYPKHVKRSDIHENNHVMVMNNG